MEQSPTAGSPPAWVARRFPDAQVGLQAYADLLASEGVVRGLIGPREVPRLWERHILNCAVAAEPLPRNAVVVDLGSGAGLPGIPMALVRPDLQVHLVEPLARRVAFLHEAVVELGLTGRVHVHRGRAQGGTVVGLEGPYDQKPLPDLPAADVVTSRAVAALEVLADWCLPLARVGGEVLALKGDQADAEIPAAGPVIAAWGGADPELLTVGAPDLDPPTTLVRIRRISDAQPAQRPLPKRRTRD